MYCRHCGTQVDSKFCPNCGKPANENLSPYHQPDAPTPENLRKPIAKQWWFWVLIVVTVIALLVTAYSLEPESKQTVINKPAEKTATAVDEATTEAVKPSKQAASFATEAPAEQADQVTIPQTVLFDQDGITITVTGLTFEDWYGPEIQFLAENNSNSAYTMQVRNVSINGAMASTICSCEVAAGEKINDTISFDTTELDTIGIDVIRQIEFNVMIFNPETWDTLYYTDPILLQTNAAQNVEQTFDDSGFVALDEGGIRFIVRGVSREDSIWGTDVSVYIENNSNRDVTIQLSDVSVNDYMIDPVFFCDVTAGKVAYSTMSFDADTLTENGISTFDTLEFSLGIYDYTTWETILESDPIQVNLS